VKLTGVFPVLLVGLLAGWSATGAQPADSANFKALMVAEARAIDTLHMANAAPFHAKDAEDVFFDIAPLKYKGWSEFEEGAQKLLSQWQSMKCELGDDVQTHQQESLAWGAATWHCDIVDKAGAKQGMDGRWTVIWEKRGKDWLVVHEHFSVPLPTPAEGAK
jgi:ketosteroid isomerase-like protein